MSSDQGEQKMNLDIGAGATWSPATQKGPGTSGLGPQIPPNAPPNDSAIARPESGLIRTTGLETKIGGKKPAEKQTPLISKLPGRGGLPHAATVKDRSNG